MTDQTDPTHAYWIRDPARPERLGEAISGWCPIADIPDYGITGTAPLPCRVEVTPRDQDGGMIAVSPPVFGTRHAYRFRAVLTARDLEALPGWDLSTFRRQLHVYRIEAPHRGTSRENWWWAHRDGAWRPVMEDTTPVRLMKSWTGPMLEILARTHPDRDALLSAWQEQIDAHNAALARRRAAQPASVRAGPRKSEGCLVVAPRPIHFQSDTIRQHFQLRRRGGSRRFYPAVGGVFYGVPHKEMCVITPQTLRDPDIIADLSGLAGYVAALIGAAFDGFEDTAHGRMALAQIWQPVLGSWKSRAMAHLATDPGENTRARSSDIAAARAGLRMIATLGPESLNRHPFVQARIKDLAEALDAARALPTEAG